MLPIHETLSLFLLISVFIVKKKYMTSACRLSTLDCPTNWDPNKLICRLECSIAFMMQASTNRLYIILALVTYYWKLKKPIYLPILLMLKNKTKLLYLNLWACQAANDFFSSVSL